MAEVIKLRREYKFGAKNIKEIVLDLEELSGQDLVFAEKEYKARNKGATVKELEDGWALTVASKASGIKYGDLLGLKGTDYRGNGSTRGRNEERRPEIIQLLDTVTDILEALNFSNEYKSSLNMSYETLMSCSLYELEYWQTRAEELIQEAEMRYEESKE